jgi:hypothetical protein
LENFKNKLIQKQYSRITDFIMAQFLNNSQMQAFLENKESNIPNDLEEECDEIKEQLKNLSGIKKPILILISLY